MFVSFTLYFLLLFSVIKSEISQVIEVSNRMKRASHRHFFVGRITRPGYQGKSNSSSTVAPKFEYPEYNSTNAYRYSTLGEDNNHNPTTDLGTNPGYPYNSHRVAASNQDFKNSEPPKQYGIHQQQPGSETSRHHFIGNVQILPDRRHHQTRVAAANSQSGRKFQQYPPTLYSRPQKDQNVEKTGEPAILPSYDQATQPKFNSSNVDEINNEEVKYPVLNINKTSWVPDRSQQFKVDTDAINYESSEEYPDLKPDYNEETADGYNQAEYYPPNNYQVGSTNLTHLPNVHVEPITNPEENPSSYSYNVPYYPTKQQGIPTTDGNGQENNLPSSYDPNKFRILEKNGQRVLDEMTPGKEEHLQSTNKFQDPRNTSQSRAKDFSPVEDGQRVYNQGNHLQSSYGPTKFGGFQQGFPPISPYGQEDNLQNYTNPLDPKAVTTDFTLPENNNQGNQGHLLPTSYNPIKFPRPNGLQQVTTSEASSPVKSSSYDLNKLQAPKAVTTNQVKISSHSSNDPTKVQPEETSTYLEDKKLLDAINAYDQESLASGVKNPLENNGQGLPIASNSSNNRNGQNLVSQQAFPIPAGQSRDIPLETTYPELQPQQGSIQPYYPQDNNKGNPPPISEIPRALGAGQEDNTLPNKGDPQTSTFVGHSKMQQEFHYSMSKVDESLGQPNHGGNINSFPFDGTVFRTSFNSPIPVNGTILEPGQTIPGSPQYQVPNGFRARVKPVSTPKLFYSQNRNSGNSDVDFGSRNSQYSDHYGTSVQKPAVGYQTVRSGQLVAVPSKCVFNRSGRLCYGVPRVRKICTRTYRSD